MNTVNGMAEIEEQALGTNPSQAVAGVTPLINFTGKGKELFWLYLKNMCFTVLTLGIYHFWGKVNIRKYLWENTLVMGEPLEYTGTGKELFISFLIALPCFLAFAFTITYLQMKQPLIILGIFPFAFYLIEVAVYSALRYRLTRTRWRGIRGNMKGSAFAYALRATGYLFLALFSGGILFPWYMSKTTKLRLNDAVIGNRAVQFAGPASTLYKPFFLYLGMVAVMVIAFVSIMGSTTLFNPADPAAIMALLPLLTAAYIAFIFSFIVLIAFFQVTVFRWFADYTNFGKMRFQSTLKTFPYMGMIFKNMLIIVFTLGIGFAWTHVRHLRFVLNSFHFTGDPQLSELLQDTLQAPKHGEGMLEALDVDLAL